MKNSILFISLISVVLFSCQELPELNPNSATGPSMTVYDLNTSLLPLLENNDNQVYIDINNDGNNDLFIGSGTSYNYAEPQERCIRTMNLQFSNPNLEVFRDISYIENNVNTNYCNTLPYEEAAYCYDINSTFYFFEELNAVTAFNNTFDFLFVNPLLVDKSIYLFGGLGTFTIPEYNLCYIGKSFSYMNEGINYVIFRLKSGPDYYYGWVEFLFEGSESIIDFNAVESVTLTRAALANEANRLPF